MRIERHVFGSVSGYATLARSAGLSEADGRALESTSFGTPYDPAYRSSLQRCAAYLSRPLGVDRRAITRVLAGPADDEGRPTLLFVTAVISASDWDRVLQGDVRPLLRQTAVWNWDGSPSLAALTMNRVTPARLELSAVGWQRVLGLVSLVELSWTSRHIVVVRESDYSFDELAAVERLLPPDARRGYSAAYRSLNPDLAVRLNCIAGGVPASGSNPARTLCGAKSPYALHLEMMGIGDAAGPLLLDYVGFGQPRVQFGVAVEEDDSVDSVRSRANAIPRRGTTLMRVAMFALVAIVALLIGAAAGWVTRQTTLPEPPPPPAWDQVAAWSPQLAAPRSADRLSAIDAMISTIEQAGLAETDAAKKLRSELESRKKAAEAASAQIADALDAIRAVAPDKPDAAEVARGKIEGLVSLLDPAVVSAFREWAQDRQRPTEDRFDKLADAIRTRLSEQAAAFADPSPPAHEKSLVEADSLAGTFEVLASLGEYGDRLVDPNARQRVRAFLEQRRSTEAKAQSMAAAIGKVIEAARILSVAAEGLRQTPTDEKKFAEVLESLKGFAQTQTEEDVRKALTLVAEALDQTRGANKGKNKP